MQMPIFRLILVALLTSVAVIGCASKPTQLDQHFGEAVNAAKAQQIINPDAPQTLSPVAGVDGQAGTAAMDRYHRSFTQVPTSTNVFNIGIGGSK
jgi:hypothetical protein